MYVCGPSSPNGNQTVKMDLAISNRGESVTIPTAMSLLILSLKNTVSVAGITSETSLFVTCLSGEVVSHVPHRPVLLQQETRAQTVRGRSVAATGMLRGDAEVEAG